MGVLDTLIKSMLDKYAGQFLVPGYDIQFKFWSSTVYMKNVRIRGEALDFLGLPVEVKYGYVGNMQIEYSVTALTTKPVVVHIKDLFVVAGPKKEKKMTEEEKNEFEAQQLEASQQAKENSLQIWEQGRFEKEGKQVYGTADKIVDNLQINVQHVHIRFEGEDYSVGVGLKGLRLFPTDAEGNEMKKFTGDPTPKFRHRTLHLDSLSIYLNTKLQTVIGGKEGIDEALGDLFAKSPRRSWSYIIPPIEGTLTLAKAFPSELELSKEGKNAPPKMAIRLEIGVSVNISRMQYNKVLRLTEELQSPPVDEEEEEKKKQQAAKLAPVASKEEKIKYLKFYVQKFKTEKSDPIVALTKKEDDWMKQFETKYVIQESLRLRVRALDAACRVLKIQEQNELQLKDGKRGMLGSLFGRRQAKPELPAAEWEDIAEGKHWEKEAKEKEEALQDMRSKLPKTYASMTVDAVMSHFVFSMLSVNNDETHGPQGAEKIIECEVKSLRCAVKQRVDSMEVVATIQRIAAYDHFTKGTAHRAFLRRKAEARIEEKEENMVYVRYEQNPPNSNLDMDLTARVGGVDIVYVPPLIGKILWFVVPIKPVNLDQLRQSATTVAEARLKEARKNLEKALENRQRVNMKLRLAAPNLIVSANPLDQKADMIVVDLGVILFRSDLALDPPSMSGEESKKALEAANKTSVLNEEWERKFYDKFRVEIQQVSLFLTRGWRNHEIGKRSMILDPLEIPVSLATAISPLIVTLPTTSVHGNMGRLHLRISPIRLMRIMKIVEYVTRDTMEEVASAPPPTSAPQPGRPPRPAIEDKKKENIGENKQKEEGEQKDDSKTGAASTPETDYRNLSIQLGMVLDEISLLIIDDHNAGPDGVGKGVIKLAISKVAVGFSQRTHDMKVKLSVGEICIEDLLQKNREEFKYLLATNETAAPLIHMADQREEEVVKFAGADAMNVQDAKTQNKRDSTKDASTFIDIQFDDVSPEAKDIYKECQKHLRMKVGTLLLALNKETLPEFAHFFMYKLMPPSAAAEDEVKALKGSEETKTEEQLLEEEKASKKLREERRKKLAEYLKGKKDVGNTTNIKVEAGFEAMQLMLNVHGRICSRARIARFGAEFNDTDKDMSAKVTLHGVWLADLTGSRGKHPYCISTKSNYLGNQTELIQAEFQKIKPPEGDEDWTPPEYLTKKQPAGTRLKASVSGIRVVVLAGFLKGLAAFPNPLLAELNKPPPPDAFAASVAAGGLTTPARERKNSRKTNVVVRTPRSKAIVAAKERQAKVEEEKKKKAPYEMIWLEVSLENISARIPASSTKTESLHFDLEKLTLSSSLKASSDIKYSSTELPNGSLLEDIQVHIHNPEVENGPGARIYSDSLDTNDEDEKREPKIIQLPLINLPETKLDLFRVVSQSVETKTEDRKSWDMLVDGHIKPIPLLISGPQLEFLMALSNGNLAEKPCFGDEDEENSQTTKPAPAAHTSEKRGLQAITEEPAEEKEDKDDAGDLAEAREETKSEHQKNATVGTEAIVRVKFEEMAIILLEKPNDDISRAMAMRWEIAAEMRSRRSGAIEVAAGLEKVYLFNHSVVQGTPLHQQIENLNDDNVLMGPTRIDLNYMQTPSVLLPGHSLMDVKVNGQRADLRIGYRDYALVLACLGSLSGTSTEGNKESKVKDGEDRKEDSKDKGTEVDNKKKKIKKSALDISQYMPQTLTWDALSRGASRLEVESGSSFSGKKELEGRQSKGLADGNKNADLRRAKDGIDIEGSGELRVSVRLNGGSIQFVNDVLGVPLPLAKFNFDALGLQMYAFGSQQSALSLTTGAEAWFYNQAICGWEPMLEPWHVGVNADLIGGNYAISSNNPLLLNVSRGMLDSVMASVELLTTAQESNSKGEQKKKFHPYVIVNETNEEVKLHFRHSLRAKEGNEEKKLMVVAPGQTAALDGLELDRPSRVYLSVRARDTLEIDPRRVGKKPFVVSRLGQDARAAAAQQGKETEETVPPPLVATVELKQGSRMLTVRPTLAFKNLTAAPLEVIISKAATDLKKTVEPGAKVWLSGASSLVDVAFRITSKGCSMQPRIKQLQAPACEGKESEVMKCFEDDSKNEEKSFNWADLLKMSRNSANGGGGMKLLRAHGNSDAKNTAPIFWYVFSEVIREDEDTWTVVAHSPIMVRNLLPAGLQIRITNGRKEEAKVQPIIAEIDSAGSYHCLSADPEAVNIEIKAPWLEGKGDAWSEPFGLTNQRKLLEVTLGDGDGGRDYFKVSVEISRSVKEAEDGEDTNNGSVKEEEICGGSFVVHIYADVWVYDSVNTAGNNKLALVLGASNEHALIPRFKAIKSIQGEKSETAGKKEDEPGKILVPPTFLIGSGINKVNMRIKEAVDGKEEWYHGDWSPEPIEIGVAGLSGVVECIGAPPSQGSDAYRQAKLLSKRLNRGSGIACGCGGDRAKGNSGGGCFRRLVDPVARRAYSLGYILTLAPPPFERTRVLTVSPRHFITNELSFPVVIKQALEEVPLEPETIIVKTGETISFNWTHAFLDRTAKFRFLAPSPSQETEMEAMDARWEWSWSGPVGIDRPGDFGFLMRCHGAQYQVRCEVRSNGPSLFAVLKPEHPLTPPVRVVNATSRCLVRFSQKGADLWSQVEPYQEVGYSWDYPLDTMGLSVQLSLLEDDTRDEAAGNQLGKGPERKGADDRDFANGFALAAAIDQLDVANLRLDFRDEHGLKEVYIGRAGGKDKIYVLLVQDGPTHVLAVSDTPLPGLKQGDAGAVLAAVGYGVRLPTAVQEYDTLMRQARRAEKSLKNGWTALKEAEREMEEKAAETERAQKVHAAADDAGNSGGFVELKVMNLRGVTGASKGNLDVVVTLGVSRGASEQQQVKRLSLIQLTSGDGVLLHSPERDGRILTVAIYKKGKLFGDTYLGGCSLKIDDLAAVDEKRLPHKKSIPRYSERWLPLDQEKRAADDELPPTDGEVLIRITFYPSSRIWVDSSTKRHRDVVARASRVLQGLKPQLSLAQARAEEEERLQRLRGKSIMNLSSFRCHCTCLGREKTKETRPSGQDLSSNVQQVEERVSVMVESPSTFDGLEIVPGEEEILLVFQLGGQVRLLPFVAVETNQYKRRATPESSYVDFLVPAPLDAHTTQIKVTAIAVDTKTKAIRRKLGSGIISNLSGVKVSHGEETVAEKARKLISEKEADRFSDNTDDSVRMLKLVSSGRSGRGSVLFGEELSVHVSRRELPHASERSNMNLLLTLEQIGISLINSSPEEFFFLSVNWILTTASLGPTTTSFDLAVDSIQLDLLENNAEYPVIFAPTAMAPDKRQPFIQLGVAIAKRQAEAPVTVFRFFSILIQQIDLKVEEELINRLIAYFTDISAQATQDTDAPRQLVWGSGAMEEEDIEMAIFSDLNWYIKPPPGGANKMFFRLLQLQPLAINLSFKLSGKTNKGGDSDGLMLNPFRILGQMAGAAFGNLSNAPLRLNSLTIENAYGDQATLLGPIISHYTTQGLGQVYKLVGSIEILGDPVALVGNLGEGVADFFYEPAQGLVRSPQAFGLGLAKGTASLLKHTITGVFGAASKVTGSIGRGIATLSMDEQYTLERQRELKEPPQHVGEGLYRGGKRLVFGIFRGVTGIFTDPYYGARREGVGGFFKGVGVGLAGVIVKPAVGAVDFTSLTLQGIGNTATFFDTKYKNKIFRPRRYIGPSGKVGLYNYKLSLMQQEAEEIATKDDRRRHRQHKKEEMYMKNEFLLGAIEANPHTRVLATNFRLVVSVPEMPPRGAYIEYNLSRAELKNFSIAWSELRSAEAKENLLILTKEHEKNEIQKHRVVFTGESKLKSDQVATATASIINRIDKAMDEIDNDAARLSIGPVDLSELPETVEHSQGPVLLEPVTDKDEAEVGANELKYDQSRSLI